MRKKSVIKKVILDLKEEVINVLNSKTKIKITSEKISVAKPKKQSDSFNRVKVTITGFIERGVDTKKRFNNKKPTIVNKLAHKDDSMDEKNVERRNNITLKCDIVYLNAQCY